MREEHYPNSSFHYAAAPLSPALDPFNHPTSFLLNKIQDQQVYLCLASTLLRLAKESGASEDAIKNVHNSLLTARGLEGMHISKLSNQPQGMMESKLEEYGWLDQGCSLKEEQTLISKLEGEILKSRENESYYKCLRKYKSEKSDEIAPSANGGPNSRKERFKKMIRDRHSRGAVESSDFYKFQISQILQNSFKYENECYRTMNSFSHLKTMFGHTSEPDMETSSQIFNTILDKTENLIITGGEEGLLKVWHKASGSLISNIKGHTDFLNKIDTSSCNKYLMTSAGDGLRFFDLTTLKPLGGWKTTSIQEVSSFMNEGKNLFLFGDNSYLYVLEQEVMLANAHRRLSQQHFYRFYFGDMAEQNSSIFVISISPQKTHMLLGLENGQMLMVLLSDLLVALQVNKPGDPLNLPCLLPVRAHSKQIIEIKWSNQHSLWATGAKDGRCCLWELNNQRMQLLTTLNVNAKGQRGRRKRNGYSCTYICWNCVFSHFAAGFQENVDEDDSDRGRGQVLVFSLKQNRVTVELSRDVSQQYGGIRAMDAHPYYPNILLICEADGHVLLFDIFIGCVVNTFQQRGYHILHPQFQLIPTECHFSKDGLSFIVATEYGSISLYGYDSKCFYMGTPVEQFLTTDFEQFQIEETSMRALPLNREGDQDINFLPKGELLSVRGQKHSHALSIETESFLLTLRRTIEVSSHIPSYRIDKNFIDIVRHNHKESELQEQIYARNYEDVQKMKQLVLFHERERQYLKVLNIIEEKIKTFRLSYRQSGKKNQFENQMEDQMIAEEVKPIRKIERRAERQQRINYVDDFEYHDSQEEDYEASASYLQNEAPQEIDEDFSDEEDQQVGRRLRRVRNGRRQTRGQNRVNLQYNEVEDEQPEILTRRRRRDVTDDIQEQEIEQLPRKKQKLDDESEEQKSYSRLKKQADDSKEMGQFVGQCYRCQIMRATVFCYNCPYSQQFCEQCWKMRGKRVRDRFSCLICIYLKNSAEEEYQNVSEESYRALSKSEINYVPQLEDKVRFFFQGYEEFLVLNIHKLNNSVYRKNQAFRLLPHTEENSLASTPLCQVASIQYYFPLKSENLPLSKRSPGKGDKSTIQMVIGLKPQPEGQVFWVYYWPGQQFLVREEIYNQISEKDLISKLSINQLVMLKDEQMQIVELGPFEDRFPETIWKIIKVRKTEGKRLRGNTKDIEKRVNVWRISEEVDYKLKESSIQFKHEEVLVKQLREWTSSADSPFCLFIDYVDFDIYPLYRQQIQIGMCLQTILSRLENKYYSGYQSLQHDIDLILTNSMKFNGQNHSVTKSAEQLCLLLKEIISTGEVTFPPSINVSAFSKEDSSSKRDRRLKVSEQNFSGSFQNEHSWKRKEDSQAHLKKRRKQSSEYEEESGSEEHFDVGVRTRKGKNRNSREEPKRVTRSGTRHH